MVLHTITAEKALSKLRRKLFVPKIDDKCRKIKCPSVDEPECVRMKRNDLGINVHVIVVNKCELYYMQCHDNVEAKIVPMKFCSHNHGPVKKIMKDKSHSRVKRAVNEQGSKVSFIFTRLCTRVLCLSYSNQYVIIKILLFFNRKW
ncbi:uncharacterized protein LOC126911836 [Spodoptera frugiperda]|uniref:Uncharacterized protein LOC126911836 n=1 Tax=Spodoptera frugiperda TaxID=7108 RepID=A0A9R0F1C7_SPOFR|nr:uncharacterized protein LOC126911836 [Spodoptera frugiperda]